MASYKPGGIQQILERSAEGMAILRRQPGFISYQAFQTGENAVFAMSLWESRELAEQGYGRFLEWLRANLADIYESIQTYEGEEIIHDSASQ
jgi:heme-degrading monooxygenase HmoA